MKNDFKYLIEVAMPVREVSAESVRDKSIRHGHISTLHLWWARRPLPVCRAVVFASLVPDPDDEHCPVVFQQAIDLLLGATANPTDPYKPYTDIPYTSAVDPVEDTRRNRLLTFIGKYSDTFIANEKAGKATASGHQISEHSLIKWDNKNNEKILNIARKLIWVAHNATPQPPEGGALDLGGTTPPSGGWGVNDLLADFDRHYQAIKDAERALYQTTDRHLETPENEAKEAGLKTATDAFLDRMPRLFDPFAGGGAIPLEAARLGCRTFGNDINPVAHIIQRGSLEFPQRYGKPITFSKDEFEKLYGADTYRTMLQNGQIKQDGTVHIKNRLSHDVVFYAKRLLKEAEAAVGQYYPTVNGRKPIAYYWARVGTCANPSCRAEVPLLKQFYLCNKPDKKVYLKPIIEGKQIDFVVREGSYEGEGWLSRGNLKCPCCNNITPNAELKRQFNNGLSSERLIAVIEEEVKNGKAYRLPTLTEIELAKITVDETMRPTEAIPVEYTKAMAFCLWGYSKWGEIISNRQLLTLQTLVEQLSRLKQEWSNEGFVHDLSDYKKAVLTYLGIFLDRIAIRQTTFGTWDVTRETLANVFGRQAILMIFDYAESNLFCSVTGSALNQVDWITRYVEEESVNPFPVELKNASSGDVHQFTPKFLNASVTDPPYYDAIAYADLSDFFYVWLKRTLGDVFPMTFALPQTPKAEECTALKHHHKGSVKNAKQHFETKLQHIFSSIEQQTSGVVSIMFAHQSTEAWTTLCNSILSSRMNITGSWAIDTELGNRLVGIGNAALESSVTVSCRPTAQTGIGEFREVKRAIEKAVRDEVRTLTALGFRGADLLTACFGQTVSVFGQYQLVEKPNGDEVTVAELLELARESAFNAIVNDIDTDEYTRFYLAWLQLNGFAEADHDDVRRLVQMSLSVNVADIEGHRLLLQNGNRQTLATGIDRTFTGRSIGQSPDSPMIDNLHQAMFRWAGTDRRSLVQYIGQVASTPEAPFWRVLASLFELLPRGTADHRAAEGLLSGKDSLLREARAMGQTTATAQSAQLGLEF